MADWIDRWTALRDVGPGTTANREYRIRRFIRPYWGMRTLNSLTGEEIAGWERTLPRADRVSRGTAKDARSLLHTILGDAATARPPLIPFNPPSARATAGAVPAAGSTAARSAHGRHRLRCCSWPSEPHC